MLKLPDRIFESKPETDLCSKLKKVDEFGSSEVASAANCDDKLPIIKYDPKSKTILRKSDLGKEDQAKQAKKKGKQLIIKRDATNPYLISGGKKLCKARNTVAS